MRKCYLGISADGVTAAGNDSGVRVRASGVTVTDLSLACATTDGGDAVTLRGNGFAPRAVVMFGGVAATGVVVLDAQTISAAIPASLSAGSAVISVTNPGGERGSLTNAFRYTSPFDPDGCAPPRRRIGVH